MQAAEPHAPFVGYHDDSDSPLMADHVMSRFDDRDTNPLLTCA